MTACEHRADINQSICSPPHLGCSSQGMDEQSDAFATRESGAGFSLSRGEMAGGEGGRFTQIEARGEGGKAGNDETKAGQGWVVRENSNELLHDVSV